MKTKRIPQFVAGLFALLLFAPALQADWSFVMLGDTRGDSNTTTGVSLYLNLIAEKIASLSTKPDLVMMAGDMANGNCLTSDSPLYPAGGDFTSPAAYSLYTNEFAAWKTAMQPVYNYSTSTGIPIYTVRGNHEINDTEGAPIPVLTQAYYDSFSARMPTNGPNNGLTDDQRGFSWSFTHKGVTFVAADQYFNYTNASPTQLSGYHSLDQAWVAQQFQQTNSPYKIFMAHEPIFQTVGNGPGALSADEEAQHFFGTNAAALQVRADFWNALGTNGVQLYLTGHLHLETVASTTNDYGDTIIQLTAGNGGAPPQPFIDNPEPGVTTLFNNGNTLVNTNGNWVVNGTFGFSVATVGATNMTIQYYSLDPSTTNWTVASYVTQISPNLISVPEPSSAVLLASAMVAWMTGYFRKRRRS